MDLTCQICKNEYESTPIVLPCGWTICEHHIDTQIFHYDCPLCNSDHRTDRKYAVNKSVEIRLNEKKLLERLKRAQSLVADLRMAQCDPYCYVYEHFDKLINKIHVREAELIETIQSHFDAMIGTVKKVRDDFKSVEEANDTLAVEAAHLNSTDLEKCEQDLRALGGESDLRKANCSLLELDQRLAKSSERLAEIEDYLNKPIEALLEHKTYELEVSTSALNCDQLFGKLVVKDSKDKEHKKLADCTDDSPAQAPLVRLCRLLVDDNEELGFTIAGSNSSHGVFVVKHIKKGSPAALGGLRNNDYIIEVCGQNVQDLKYSAFVSLIKKRMHLKNLQLLVADSFTIRWYKNRNIPISSHDELEI